MRKRNSIFPANHVFGSSTLLGVPLISKVSEFWSEYRVCSQVRPTVVDGVHLIVTMKISQNCRNDLTRTYKWAL